MAVSRLSQTTLQNAFQKFNNVWDGVSAVGAMEAISSVVLNATQTTVEFNNIPQTYSHLHLRTSINNSVNVSIQTRFNNDSSALYTRHFISGDGGGTVTGFKAVDINNIGTLLASSTVTNNFQTNIVDILDYSSTNKFKTARSISGVDYNGSGYVALISGLYRSTNAITTFNLISAGGTFSVGSTFTLYGIK